MTDIDNILKILDSIPEPKDDSLKIQAYPCIIPDSKWPALVLDKETIQFWSELNEDFLIEVLSPISNLKHAVTSFISECGVEDLFYACVCPNSHFDREATRALNLGLVYHQPFLIDASVSYSTYSTADGTEYDCDVAAEVIHATPLPAAETISRWEEWLKRNTSK